jgi:hypothetical protein
MNLRHSLAPAKTAHRPPDPVPVEEPPEPRPVPDEEPVPDHNPSRTPLT